VPSLLWGRPESLDPGTGSGSFLFKSGGTRQAIVGESGLKKSVKNKNLHKIQYTKINSKIKRVKQYHKQ
jgi:hypothetical protein